MTPPTNKASGDQPASLCGSSSACSTCGLVCQEQICGTRLEVGALRTSPSLGTWCSNKRKASGGSPGSHILTLYPDSEKRMEPNYTENLPRGKWTEILGREIYREEKCHTVLRPLPPAPITHSAENCPAKWVRQQLRGPSRASGELYHSLSHKDFWPEVSMASLEQLPDHRLGGFRVAARTVGTAPGAG